MKKRIRLLDIKTGERLKDLGRCEKSSWRLKDLLKSKNLVEQAYVQIKRMIFQQKVSPGQRLIYQDLCDLLKMSRTPVINALIRLEREGFLVSQPNRGFSVKPIDLQEAMDLFGVREALEVYAIEQAILRIKEKDNLLFELEKKLADHEAYMPHSYDRRKFWLDAELHIQIARISRNDVLESYLRTNLEHVYLRYNLEGYNPKRMLKAVEEHRKILLKVRSKDVAGAIRVLRQHIRAARDNVTETLSREKEWSSSV
jgi:DNA-binding GntR family transcriptional regulator